MRFMRPSGHGQILLLTITTMAVTAALAAAGCTVGGSPTSSPDRSLMAPPPNALEPVPPSAAPVTGEVPDGILRRVRDDLAGRIGGDVSGAIVVLGEAVVWNDGSLGCPERGMFYTQALVPGHHIVLELDGQRYDYRSDERGIVRLCQPRAPAGQP